MFQVTTPSDGQVWEFTFYHHRDVLLDGTHHPYETLCIIRSMDQAYKSYQAYATCHWKDNFNKDTGRKLSLGRALTEMGLTTADRKAFWEVYLARLRAKE